MQLGKYLVFVASGVGFIVSLAFFVVTFSSRPMLEDAMSDFVRSRVEQEVREQLGPGADAGALPRWFERRADAAVDFLENDLDAFVDAVVDSLCDIDCEESKEEELSDSVRGFAEALAKSTIDDLEAMSTQLKRYIRGKYLELVHSLIFELRIFSSINAGLFATILAFLLIRWRDPREVLLPATLLLAATLTCAALYAFNQNWFFSIFLQRYWGYSYLTFVGVVFGLLVDIAFNKGRITRAILDLLTSGLAP